LFHAQSTTCQRLVTVEFLNGNFNFCRIQPTNADACHEIYVKGKVLLIKSKEDNTNDDTR
jgi:hypothetical protein